MSTPIELLLASFEPAQHAIAADKPLADMFRFGIKKKEENETVQ